jgi:transposase
MPVSPETKEFVTKISTEMMPYLNEKQKRIFVGIIANAIGYGGIETVKDMTGKSRTTIAAGASEVKAAAKVSDATKKTDSVKPNGAPRLRKPGGGRKSAVSKNPDLPKWIEEIIDNSTYGVPTKVLRWTTMSLRKIAEQVNTDHNVKISQNIVSDVLDQLGYSKQQNQKSLQLGEQHPDRNAQFEFINNKSASFLNENQPVISVDTKKKELVGNFKNNGQEYRKSRDPRKVLDHDFAIEGLGKVAPYGIYVVNDEHRLFCYISKNWQGKPLIRVPANCSDPRRVSRHRDVERYDPRLSPVLLCPLSGIPRRADEAVKTSCFPFASGCYNLVLLLTGSLPDAGLCVPRSTSVLRERGSDSPDACREPLVCMAYPSPPVFPTRKAPEV